ncbi:MAG: class I SAM-dependent methyltransferase [Pseudomonadota bacterium]
MLELGLGNGRTYDHLRSLFPDHEIFVFDPRDCCASRLHSAGRPCPARRLPRQRSPRPRRGSAGAPSWHMAIFGSADPERTAALARFLWPGARSAARARRLRGQRSADVGGTLATLAAPRPRSSATAISSGRSAPSHDGRQAPPARGPAKR